MASVTLCSMVAECLQVSSLVILLLVLHGSSGVSEQHCNGVVTVDQTATNAFCSSTTMEVEGICNDLQGALLFIAQSSNGFFNGTPSLSCTEVRVLSGSFIISEFIKFEQQNVAIRGDNLVEVSFDFHPTETIDPIYIVSFINSGFAEVSGINFSGSPGIIAFENVTNVIVKESSFSYFQQGAVDIFNCGNISVMDSQFSHSGSVPVNKNQAYRGHAGGLSVGYNLAGGSLIPLQVLIADSNFVNNSARALTTTRRTFAQLLERLIFIGRGGGCMVILNSEQPITVKVERCKFEENYARYIGGGLYIVWGILMQPNVTIVSSSTVMYFILSFVRNRTPRGAGGLEIFIIRGLEVNSTELAGGIAVYHSEFIENQANYGAGTNIFVGGSKRFEVGVGNLVRFENCTFSGNRAEYGGGLAVMISSLSIIFQNREGLRPIEIANCTFTGNYGSSGGTVSTAYYPIQFDGVNTFANNTARAMVILGAFVRVYGHLRFTGNVAKGTDGGALYISSLGQVQLFDGSSMSFENNQGNLGASLVVNNLFIPLIAYRLFFNPLCFLSLQQRTESPLQKSLDTIQISFSGNRAVVGSAVYANDLALCSWSQLQEPFFNDSLAFRWNFFNYSDDNCNSAHVGNECSPQWYVQTPVSWLEFTDEVVTAYPGERFNLGVMAYDELEQLTAAVFRISNSTTCNTSDPVCAKGEGYGFDPSAVFYQSIEATGVPISFHALSQDPPKQTQTVFAQSLLTDSQLTSVSSFQVEVKACPAGYNLSLNPFDNETFTCQCDDNNTDIIACNDRKIMILEGLWGTVGSTESGDPSLVTYSCPHEYCCCDPETIFTKNICFFAVNSSDIDAQCNSDREGILCGKCKNGIGVSALLNHCVSCSDSYALLIVALVLCNVVIFTVFLLFLPRVPSWVYPCVFYVQILPYLSEHFPVTFEKFDGPVHYVASALGFYFCYDFCLYSNMSPVFSYFLRFVPLLTSLIVCPVVLLLRRKAPWHGLWWIVLFQYTHVVHTALSILNCPRLLGPNGNTLPRWYVSGNIQCFTGWHAPLGGVAILVLILCVALIPVTAKISLGKIKRPRWMSRLVQPLTLSFHIKYKWWAAVELTRRLLILVFIVAFPGNTYPSAVIIMLVIVLYAFMLPYVGKVGTVLEVILSVDVLILLLLRNTNQATDKLQSISTNISSASLEGNHGLRPAFLAWTLFPFYYIPLVVSVVSAFIWITINLPRRVYRVLKCTSKSKHSSVTFDDEEIDQNLLVPRREFSRSEVSFKSAEIAALDNDKIFKTKDSITVSQEVEQGDEQVPMSDVLYIGYNDQPK